MCLIMHASEEANRGVPKRKQCPLFVIFPLEIFPKRRISDTFYTADGLAAGTERNLLIFTHHATVPAASSSRVFPVFFFRPQ
jgi:hypothetical protein